MNDNVDALLDMLDDQADSATYEMLDSYEQEAAYEAENLMIGRGVDRNRARRLSPKVARNRSVLSQLRGSGGGRGQGNGLRKAPSAQGQPANYAAQFDIVVTRDSNNIPGNIDLPYALFAPIEAEAAYGAFIDVPAGLTLTVTYGVHDAQPNALVFDYFDGVNRDTVTVTCRQVPYPLFLKSIETDLQQINNFKYVVSDASQQAQFNRQLLTKSRSMYGKTEENSLSLEAYFSKNQFQTGLREIPIVLDLDKETAMTSNIIAVAGFSVTYTMFVQKFDRRSAIGKW